MTGAFDEYSLQRKGIRFKIEGSYFPINRCISYLSFPTILREIAVTTFPSFSNIDPRDTVYTIFFDMSQQDGLKVEENIGVANAWLSFKVTGTEKRKGRNITERQGLVWQDYLVAKTIPIEAVLVCQDLCIRKSFITKH